MRILLTLGTSTGGVGTHVRALARELSSEHTVAVLAPPSTIEHFEFANLPQVQVLPCPMSTQIHPRDIKSIKRIRSQIQEFSPDVIHAHGFRAGLLTLLARPAQPTVVSWHNQATATGIKGKIQHLVERYVARRATLTIGASEDLADRATALGGSHVVFAPVAAPKPQWVDAAQAKALREELLGGRNGLLGLMVGRVAPQKNYSLLVSALSRLSDEQIHIVIAGAADADEQDRIDTLLASTNLGRCSITFLGPRSDVTALMQAADFYLLTSHWEARALVLQEALIAGLPIIASRSGGIPGLLGEAGLLVDPAAPTAAADFAQAVSKMQNPDQRRHWAALSKERGTTLPDEHEVAQILLDYYRLIL